MNVIVANKYQSMLEGLQIDVIKSLNGEFDADEIVNQFQNFFYQRMILDITAIKNYQDIRNLQKLSISLDMSKVILLLDDSPDSSSPAYLSKLISMGIYNFTRNLDGIMYLYNNPNSYRDVAQYQQLDNFSSNVTQAQAQGAAMRGAPANVAMQMTRVIGVKNVTDSSGATTLIYMMKKHLEKNYSVAIIETNKRDFMFFKEKDVFSADEGNVASVINTHKDKEVLLIDVNDSKTALSQCTDVVYLIEPSVIKLNRLMLNNPHMLSTLAGKKVMLNQSLLSSKDVLDFEYESRLNIFYNMPPLNEREKDVQVLNAFLLKLGFERQASSTNSQKKNSILGLFGK